MSEYTKEELAHSISVWGKKSVPEIIIDAVRLRKLAVQAYDFSADDVEPLMTYAEIWAILNDTAYLAEQPEE